MVRGHAGGHKKGVDDPKNIRPGDRNPREPEEQSRELWWIVGPAHGRSKAYGTDSAESDL
jgi:hypothetical protein